MIAAAAAAETFEQAVMSSITSRLAPGPVQIAARDAAFEELVGAAAAPPFAGAQPAWVAQLLAGNAASLAAAQATQVASLAALIVSTNALAVAHNSSARSAGDPLYPCVNAENVLPAAAFPPVAFPATLTGMYHMTNAVANALLAFYAIPNPHPVQGNAVQLAAKRRLLAIHLGISGF